MMSWPWGRRSMGNTRANRSGSSTQPPAISGVMAEGAQVSIPAGGPPDPAGPARAGRGPAGGHVGGGVDRQPLLLRDQRPVVVGLAVGADPVPERERHPDEAVEAWSP